MKIIDHGDVPKTTGSFESFDGTPIHYEVRGEGKPIVLCYGIACLINHWTHQIRAFSHGYQVIVLDYRGHHATPAPKDPKNLTLDALCRDINGLLGHLGLERASFWGHSFGVQLLLRYYELYPESVANFVFINGFARSPLPEVFGVDAAKPIFELFKDAHQAQPKLVTKIWKTAISSPLAIPMSSLMGGFNIALSGLKNIEVYARGVASMDLDVFIPLFEQMLSWDGTAVLDKITVPTLVVSGAKDGVTPKDRQEELHTRIRGSQFLSVPYGTHCTQLDLPDFVNLRADKFLNDIGYAAKKEVVSAPPTHARPAGARRRKRPWASTSLTED